jgi:hypothetical protein
MSSVARELGGVQDLDELKERVSAEFGREFDREPIDVEAARLDQLEVAA